jgi:hypothetical protein
LNQFLGAGPVVREIENNAAWAGMPGEDGSQDVTRCTTDVSDPGVRREVVGSRHGGRVRTVDADEEVAEPGGLVGIGGQIVEEGLAKLFVE